MRKAGLRHFRVELMRENADEARDLLDTYAGILSGAEDAGQAWKRLKALKQLGVTRGTLDTD